MVGRRALSVGIAVAIAAAVALGGLLAGSGPRSRAVAAVAKRPNIVFILTDDLSWNLVNSRFAPHIVDLQRRGETFNHYFVTDSLCCPSRSTIFTGLFPHDTKVFTNVGSHGGFHKFQSGSRRPLRTVRSMQRSSMPARGDSIFPRSFPETTLLTCSSTG